jgi:cell division protein FtsB
MFGAKNLLCVKEVRNLPPRLGLLILDGVMEPDSTEPRGRAFLSWGIRVLAVTAVAVLLSYLPYRIVAEPGEQKLQDMRTELARTRLEIAESKTEVAARQRQVQSLKTDTRTIEDIARQDLQMLYPHEKILRIKVPTAVPR